jgi:hypothetical protein
VAHIMDRLQVSFNLGSRFSDRRRVSCWSVE